MIEVEFKHWKYEFSDDDLQHGSPNKKGIAKTMLRAALQQATLVQEETVNFTVEQILCANEAFPEAAVADPLADLKIWNEWRSGVRIFPYPGNYSRLSITNQPPKTNSTSSIGVIGEIMAAIFGQALIAPEVLVRVIQRWPDFIFYPRDGRYAFLEAKAFTQRIKITSENQFGIPATEFGECLLDAVHHQNFDPFVKIWYAFTGIQQIEPICRFSTQLIELDVNQSKREGRQVIVPQLVIDGLAERAIQRGIFCLSESEADWRRILKYFSTRERNSLRENAEKKITFLAKREIEFVLNDAGIDTAMKIDRKLLEASIETQVHYLIIPESSEGDELHYSIPKQAKNDGSIFIRKLGLDSLYKMELSLDERIEIAKQWKPKLKQANEPWKSTDSNKKFWRCGSVAFSLVSDSNE
jgi:hypothetical protein